MATFFAASQRVAPTVDSRRGYRFHGCSLPSLPLILLSMLLAGHARAAAAAPPPHPAREVRALLCAGEWEKALHAAPVATVRPGAAIATGTVWFDTPILLPLQSPAESRAAFTPCSWVEFEQADGRLIAWLVLRVAGKGGAKWGARLDVFDGPAPSPTNPGTKPLFSAATRFAFQGGSYLFGNVIVADTREGEARLDLGPLHDTSRRLTFRVAFDQIESVMGAPVKLERGEPTPLRAALGAADGPELIAASNVRLERTDDTLQARVRVDTLSAPQARWRLTVRVVWRNTTAKLEASTEIANSGASIGFPLHEPRDLTLNLGSLAAAPQAEPTAVLSLEQIDGAALAGLPEKTTSLVDRDDMRASYRRSRDLPRFRPGQPPFSTGSIGARTLKLHAVARGLSEPKARLTWRLLRQAPEGWTPPPDEPTDEPGTIAWRDPATSQTWLLDAFHNDVSGGDFYFMEPGLWRVMAMGRDGKRGVFGLSDPVSLDWTTPDTTATITLVAGSPLSVALSSAANPEQKMQGWVVLRRADGLPVSAAGDDPRIQFNDVLKLPALPPGPYTATAGSRYNFYRDEYDKQPNFARREVAEFTIEAGKENKVAIALSEARLSAEQVRRHWPWVITGRVTDAAGQPLAGVTINSCADSTPGFGLPHHSGLVTTGPDGRYTMRLLRGVRGRPADHRLVEIFVEASLAKTYEKSLNRQGRLALAGQIPADVPPGSGEARRIILPGKPFQLDFVMLPAAQIRGRVVDRQGVGVANEYVSHSYKLMLDSGPSTGPDGRFTIDNAPCAEYRFSIKGAQSPPIEFKKPGQHEIELIYDDSDKQHPQLKLRPPEGPQ